MACAAAANEAPPAGPERILPAPYEKARAGPGWRDLPVSNPARRMILRGVRTRFKRHASKKGFHQPMPAHLDCEHVDRRVVEFHRLLRTGAMKRAHSQDLRVLISEGYMITPSFMVEKAGSTKGRCVFNEKRQNSLQRKKKTKFESLKMLKTCAKQGYWGLAADVLDGFHLLENHPSDQKYHTADVGAQVVARSCQPLDASALAAIKDQVGEVDNPADYWGPLPQFLVCVAMNFGGTNSPHNFSRAMAEVVKVLRVELSRRFPGSGVIVYLDDLLFLMPSYDEAIAAREVINEIFDRFGISRHPKKGFGFTDEPLQNFTHLGTGVDLAKGLYFVNKLKQARLKQQSHALLKSQAKHCRAVDAHWLIQFTGFAISNLLPLPQARYRTRALFDDLIRARAYQRKFRCNVPLSRQSLRDLTWWSQLNSLPTVGRMVWRPPTDLSATVDASTGIGWGANLGAGPLTGNPQQNIGQPASGIWSVEEKQLSITHLELKAVKELILHFRSQLRGKVLLIWEDNQGVVGILRKLCARSQVMRDDLHEIMLLLEELDLILRVRYVASAANPSDYFSRVPYKGEWLLDPALAHQLMRSLGGALCTVDRFADGLSALLPRFNSPYPVLGAETVDAFTTSWAQEDSWINPPWSLLSRIVWKLGQEPQAAATLLVPNWPAQSWFGPLMAIASSVQHLEIPAASVSVSDLASRLGVVPEILRQSGRNLNMLLVRVLAGRAVSR